MRTDRTRINRPATLFYLDPPYWGCEADYGAGVWSRSDFTALAEVLLGLKGKWLLSLNDLPEVRVVFAGFTMDQVETTYSIHESARRVRAAELIISPR